MNQTTPCNSPHLTPIQQTSVDYSNSMAKQKFVIKVTMENAKMRSKALAIAAGFLGVISTQIDGETIVVVGDGVDPIALTVTLRKKMSFAQLVSVTEVEEKKDEKKDEKKEEKKEEKKQEERNVGMQQIWPYQFPMALPPFYTYENRDSYNDCCPIL